RRERYAQLDAELDRRLEAKKLEEQRLADWERQLSEREAELRRREDAAAAAAERSGTWAHPGPALAPNLRHAV
ncbi:MAG: hypothetical protein KY439_02105, partial [Actinobacteria bacterium]|nr:hypothetical protein [Actinomycetota bacterium]